MNSMKTEACRRNLRDRLTLVGMKLDDESCTRNVIDKLLLESLSSG